MNDEELEATLRRYRGIDPPVSLRTRVLSQRAPGRVAFTTMDWGLVAAAVVLIAVATVTGIDRPKPAPVSVDAALEVDVEGLARLIGGDEGAIYARIEEEPWPTSVR